MKCPECQSVNREGVKFCEECGTRMEQVCPNCDSRIPLGKKFCGECGRKLIKEVQATSISHSKAAKDYSKQAIDYNRPESYTPKFMADKILTTRSSLKGERKIVTVFFADVAGFTSLSERLDPEEVHQIMDGCFKILMDQIHRYEGTINQFTGDGVMALFGAPLSHEDHAQRACHAALATQEALKDYGLKVKREFDVDFKMRIGLNSGPVVVGAIGDDLRMDYTAVGDTTNLAARMESMADPCHVNMTENTHRLVKKYFKISSLGKTDIKGKKEPQEIYDLEGLGDIRSRLEASAAKGLTKFVGRDHEISMLLHVFNKSKEGSGQVVSIVGEAGVGKSRLILEARSRITYEHRSIKGRCTQYGDKIPFFPWLELFKSSLDILDCDPEEVIIRKLESGLSNIDKGLISKIPAFRDLLSLSVKDKEWENLEPKEKRYGIFEAIRDFFISLSKQGPVILTIDNIHWIDKTSEELLNYFIEWIPRSKVLLLLPFRPEYNHSWGNKSFYQNINLSQLSQDSSRELIKALFSNGRVMVELEDFILRSATGNPLFIEELTYNLIESGTVQEKDGQYLVIQDISKLEVPDTVQGIIAARMDRLQDDIKRTLQIASVIGKKFAFQILQTISETGKELKDYLLQLQHLEFIYEKNLFPELEYVFRQAVTQEVAYGSLLMNKRKEIHLRTAKAIEVAYEAQLEEFYELLAYHYSRSDDKENAFKYLKLSGDKATRNHSAWEAFELYKSAMEILKGFPVTEEQKKRRLELIHQMMIPIIMQGFPEESLDILKDGVELSGDINDRSSMIRFYSNMGLFYSVRGGNKEGIVFIRKAFEEACSLNDLTLMAQTAPDLCLANFTACRFEDVIKIAEKVNEVIEKEGREDDNFGGPALVYPALLSMSGYCMSYLGRFDKGISMCQKGMEVASSKDNLFTRGLCIYYQGMISLLRGSWKEAKQSFLVGIKDLGEVNSIQVIANALSGLGLAEIYLGDLSKAREHLEEGFNQFRETGVKWQMSPQKRRLGIFHFYTGDISRAASLMDEALESAIANEEDNNKGNALIWKGRISGKINDAGRKMAEESIVYGLDVLSSIGVKPDIAKGRLFLGELYGNSGRKQDALEYIEKAEKSFNEMGMEYWAKEARDLINQIK